MSDYLCGLVLVVVGVAVFVLLKAANRQADRRLIAALRISWLLTQRECDDAQDRLRAAMARVAQLELEGRK